MTLWIAFLCAIVQLENYTEMQYVSKQMLSTAPAQVDPPEDPQKGKLDNLSTHSPLMQMDCRLKLLLLKSTISSLVSEVLRSRLLSVPSYQSPESFPVRCLITTKDEPHHSGAIGIFDDDVWVVLTQLYVYSLYSQGLSMQHCGEPVFRWGLTLTLWTWLERKSLIQQQQQVVVEANVQ